MVPPALLDIAPDASPATLDRDLAAAAAAEGLAVTGSTGAVRRDG
jgi:hypothetical protein